MKSVKTCAPPRPLAVVDRWAMLTRSSSAPNLAPAYSTWHSTPDKVSLTTHRSLIRVIILILGVELPPKRKSYYHLN